MTLSGERKHGLTLPAPDLQTLPTQRLQFDLIERPLMSVINLKL